MNEQRNLPVTAEQPLSGTGQRFVVTLPVVACALFVAFGLMSLPAKAAISWDAGSATQYWFDPVNWSNNVLPPSNGAVPPASTDTATTIATTGLPGGEGIVYDPSAGDPNFANIGSQTFPAGFEGGQTIQQLYIARAATATKLPGVPTGDGLITIKGDLTITGNVIIGRSSNVRDVPTNGTIIQKGGKVVATLGTVDLAQTETTQDGLGNGTYDYRAGTLDISRDGGNGLRLSNGTNSNALDAQVAGAGGAAKLIVHNPANHQGYIRTFNLVFNAYAGFGDGVANSFDPNGTTKGVSTAEFHYENSGVRPIQVTQTLTINNGADQVNANPSLSTMGVRSARLDLKLDSAPLAPGGIPESLGLIDVDWNPSDVFVGSITGTGDVDGDSVYNDDRIFSNANAPNPLAASAAYNQGSVVSATFGSTKYNWTISYTGTIGWTDVNNSVVSSISGTGGLDVVLIGLSTETVGVPGDYNNNGVVDSADYVVWRNGGPLQNEVSGVTPGSVTPEDYAAWRARFGNTSGSGSGLSAGAVPEPAAILLVIFGAVIGALARRKR